MNKQDVGDTGILLGLRKLILTHTTPMNLDIMLSKINQIKGQTWPESTHEVFMKVNTDKIYNEAARDLEGRKRGASV